MNLKQKIISLFVLALAISILVFNMIDLSNKELLWGHRPLFVFLCGWSFILVCFSNSFFSSQKKRSYLLLSFFSAILFFLGFPSMPFFPLIFIAFVPLLIIEKKICKDEAKPFWKVWRFTYNTFVLWNILSTFWVANTAFAPGIFAVLMNSLLMTIPFMLYHWTKKILPLNLHLVIFCAYWISFEKLHQGWELSWTWLTLGNTFAQSSSIIQWYEYTGVFGGSLWILAINYLIFKKYANENKFQVLNYKYILLGLIIPIVLSLGIYYSYEEKGFEKEVVIVQPNYEPHYKKFTVPRKTQEQKFLKLSKEGLKKDTDYLLFPETSFNRVRINDFNSIPLIKNLKKFADNYSNLKIVSGIAAHKVYDEDEEKPKDTIREFKSKGKSTFYESYNGAIQINKRGEVDFYKKSILVPGPEIFPYKNLFFFMKPLVDQLGGTLAGNGTQDKRSVFWDEAKEFAVAPVICYESIYGEYCTEYIREGASAIFVMTNDGWWDKTSGHKQHVLFSKLRAIECRRDIARSANTGISCFINQRGQILQPTSYETDAYVLGKIRMNNELTFYVKWGDLIARVSYLLSILLILNSIVKNVLKNKNQSFSNLED